MVSLTGKHRRRFPLAVLWLGGVASLLIPIIATAEIIVYEDFDAYSTGNLAGQGTAGSGWTGGWVAGPAVGLTKEVKDTSAAGAISITPAGGQSVAGGSRALDVYPPASSGTTAITGIAATRQLAAVQTGTFYAGFVVQWNSGSFDANDTVALHFTNSASDATNGFNIGYRGVNSTTSSVMARKGTGNPVAGASLTFTNTTAVVRYLVAKFEKVASTNYNKITVWVNPGTTSETSLPNGNCQLTGVDSGITSISSINLRVENLLGPNAGANGSDKVRLDSLSLATQFRDLMINARDSRPFIWVRASERQDILAKIAANPWATSVQAGIVKRVAVNQASHQSNRDAYLRKLPVDWTASPAKFKTAPTYGGAGGEAAAKFNDGVDCAVLYYLTRDTKYARCAADILHNAVKTMLPTAPSTSTTNGGWIIQDNLLYEARQVGTQLGIIYDFIYPYLQANQVYDVQTAGMVNFNFTNAQSVFRTYYQLVRDHGSLGSNWSALMSTCMMNSVLALDDATERAAALKVFLLTSSTRQASLDYDYRFYAQPGDIWPESLQYSGGVGNIRSTQMVLMERVDPSLKLFNAYPNLPSSLSRISYLTYPNGQEITFGDGHRNVDGQPFFEYELIYQHAKKRGLTNLTALYGPLINGGIAGGDYNRSTLSQYDNLGSHNEPLQLLWFAPNIPEAPTPLVLPQTDTLPYAGIALQRNPSTAGDDYGLMSFVGGAAHVHSHACGMNMELYGLGQVMGAKSGRTNYGDVPNENYYRVFASNNNIIVNGASRGENGWGGFGINTVQVVAMEPQRFEPGVSTNHSFTCSSFVDDKGTLAEGTQQRTMGIIRTSPTTGYYVDIFRSKSTVTNQVATTLNGNQTDQFHDYLYHNFGDTLDITTNGAALPLVSQPNRFQTDIGDANKQPGWRYFTNTAVSYPQSQSTRAQFKSTVSGKALYMDMHLPAVTNREYAKVNAPAIVEAPAPYDTKVAPALVVRQIGEAWNKPFAVVYEPHFGTTTSGSVTNVTTLTQAGIVVGLKVESTVAGNNLVQYVISNINATDTYTNTAAGIVFKGRFGVVTENSNGARTLYLGEGANLQYQGYTVASVSGASTQANVNFVPNQPAVVTANDPVNVTTPTNNSNTSPTITDIANRSIAVNTNTGAIPFAIGDSQTVPASLVLSKGSNNLALVPVANIVFGGSGGSRTVTVTPVANRLGSATITVTVSDGTLTATDTFDLTVTGTVQETWRFTNFGTTANTGTTADTSDANKDGESNFLEFGTGQNPNASSINTTSLVRKGAYLEFTYTRSKVALTDGVTYTVAWSDSLSATSWSSIGVAEQILTDNGIVQTVKATLPVGTGNRRFVHLSLSKP